MILQIMVHENNAETKCFLIGQLPTFSLAPTWVYYTPFYSSLQTQYESFTQGSQVDI